MDTNLHHSPPHLLRPIPYICPTLPSPVVPWTSHHAPTPSLPPTLLAAVHSQMNLGIRAFQWGLYSPLLTSYLQSLWAQDRRSPTVWFSTLSTITWRLLQDLWILRNQTLHGPTNALKEAESVLTSSIYTTKYVISPLPFFLPLIGAFSNVLPFPIFSPNRYPPVNHGCDRPKKSRQPGESAKTTIQLLATFASGFYTIPPTLFPFLMTPPIIHL